MAVPDATRRRKQFPRLNAIVDVEIAARFGWLPFDLARAFLDGGATFLQLRAKQFAGGPFLDVAERIAVVCRQYDALFVVNDRVDIAAIIGAGVHVGQEDVSPSDARAVMGDESVIGLSTHTNEQIESAAPEPIDYLAVGPIFGTVTKKTGYDAVGLAIVRRAAQTTIPVVAIGGITLESAQSVIDAGAASLAVITDLLNGANPTTRVADYLQLLAPTTSDSETAD